MKKIKNNYIVNLFLAVLISLSISYASPRLDLSWVESWAMQLQDPDIEKLRSSPYDLLVIDYSKDGTDEQAFQSSDIKILKNQGKLVLSYLSLGEVENYRFYWKTNWKVGFPNFIGAENPDWVGNYKVKYWEKDYWKMVLRPYLKKIISTGFQGVYLDVIDSYWYWGEKDNSHKDKAIKMFKLIKKIQRYANKKTGGNFAICPQNGLAILDDLPTKKRKKYLEMIDCVGVESLYYNIYSTEDQNYRLDLLEKVHQANKPIFNIEYIPATEYYNHEQLYFNSHMRIIGYPANPDRNLSDLTEL